MKLYEIVLAFIFLTALIVFCLTILGCSGAGRHITYCLTWYRGDGSREFEVKTKYDLDFLNFLVIAENKGIKVVDDNFTAELGKRTTRPDSNTVGAIAEGITRGIK